MQSSKVDFSLFSIAQLESLINARGQVIETIQREMVEIQTVIGAKQRHWLDVERFEGKSPEEIAAFHALAQGVAFSTGDAKQFGE